MATDTSAAPRGSPENPVKFRDQDFKTLLKECLKSGALFSDPAFPADQKSIGMPELDLDPKKAIKWLRPKVRPLCACTDVVFRFGNSCMDLHYIIIKP